MTRIAVVGGGVTGLAAARALRASGLEVVVLEQGRHWGGKLLPLEQTAGRIPAAANQPSAPL